MYSIDTMTSLNLGEQGEHLANELRIDMSPWLEGTEGLKCYIYVLRHAETSAYIAATTMEDDNVLLWPVSSWDTQITGAGLAQFVATDGTRIIRSKRIRTEVGTIIPGTEEDEIPEPMEAWRDELIAQITVIRNAAEAAQAGAEAAQSNAETAQAAAEDARDKALGAQGAAETARDNARTAQNAAEAARDRAVSAETAANSARDAAQGAQAAAEAAQSAAAESAAAAKTSETNAKSSELIASVNQMSALNYSKSAKQSADKAESQASMAEVAKGLAFDKADEATASASAAAQSETNAAASASAASTSESNAAASASAAAQSASQAAGSATQAGNSATSAAGSATQAGNSATAAAGSATDAAASAQDAQDVLDSIPADYSQMSADVEDLKDAVLDNAPAIIGTASGPIASFDDGADDRPIKSLVAHIEPVQAGSGDPSPDNVRPISGWTGVKVSRAGKNLLAKPFSYVSSVSNSLDECFFLKAGTYTFNVDSFTGATSWRYGIRLKDASGKDFTDAKYQPRKWMIWNTNNAMWIDGGNATEKTITIKLVEDCYIRIVFAIGDTTASTVANGAMLSIGSTALPYEPYAGQTYEVTFPSEAGTVYGGTLDVVSGKLTVNMASVDLGSLSYELNSSRFLSRNGIANAPAKNDTTAKIPVALSDRYVIKPWAHITPTGYCAGIIGNQVMISNPDYTDVARFKEAMAGIQLVYELATPQTYQLTPTEIRTLLGQNNVWADTGSTDVTYQADTKLYIDNKFTELQALVLENIGG